MPLKDTSYLELWQPPLSLERNHSCNFGRKHHEEQLCKIIFNLDKWFRRICRLKIFLIWSSGGPLVQRSGTICFKFDRRCYEEQFWETILNLDQWFRRRCHLRYFLSGALTALLFSRVEPFVLLVKRASWGTTEALEGHLLLMTYFL